jgi:hypothetical protein
MDHVKEDIYMSIDKEGRKGGWKEGRKDVQEGRKDIQEGRKGVQKKRGGKLFRKRGGKLFKSVSMLHVYTCTCAHNKTAYVGPAHTPASVWTNM